MRHPEQDIQRAILRYIRIQYPRAIVYHVPNGGVRSKREAGIFKGLGVRRGVADLCLHWRDGKTGYLEIKAARGCLSQEQKLFARDCSDIGIPCVCVKSVDDAAQVLKEWGVA